jgi:hypothetical protein
MYVLQLPVVKTTPSGLTMTEPGLSTIAPDSHLYIIICCASQVPSGPIDGTQRSYRSYVIGPHIGIYREIAANGHIVKRTELVPSSV